MRLDRRAFAWASSGETTPSFEQTWKEEREKLTDSLVLFKVAVQCHTGALYYHHLLRSLAIESIEPPPFKSSTVELINTPSSSKSPTPNFFFFYRSDSTCWRYSHCFLPTASPSPPTAAQRICALSSSTLLPLQESFFVDGLWPGKPPLKYSLQRSIIYCRGMVGFVLCFSPHLVSSTAESEFTRNFSNCDGSVPHFWPLWITPPPEKCAMMHSVSRFRFRRFLVHGRRQCGLIICDHCPKEKGSKEVWRLHVSGLCCRCCPLVFHQYFLVSCGVVYYFVSSSATMVRRMDGWLVAIGGGTESEIRASSSSSSLRLVVRRAFGRLEFEIQMAVIWKFYRNSESELFSRMMT